MVGTRASAGPGPSHSQLSSSQSIEPSAVSPAWGDYVDTSSLYWGTQGSSDRGNPSAYTSSSPSYSLPSSPESNPERWFSSPPMGSARPHYERWVCVRPSVRLSPPDALAHSGRQHLYTSSLHHLGNGTLRGYYTSSNIADTSSSHRGRMFNHVFPPFQVDVPHLTIPVHRQNGPQSPTYSANDPKSFFIAGPSSTLEVAPSTVQSGLGTPNVDSDDAINGPTVDDVLSLGDNQWRPAEQVYAAADTQPSPDTHEYSTDYPHRHTQYPITLEATSASPHQQSPSPRRHTVASHLSLSSSPPESLADVFTVNSQQWRDVAIEESETSPEVPNSVQTDQAPTTIQQDRITGITVAEVPNFCHPCGIGFTQAQVFRRHLKDKHEDKESCTHCSSFKWSRGRPHLYRRHLSLKHPEVKSSDSEDRPRRTRKLRTVAACQRNIPNRKTEATSRGVFPRPYCRCHDCISGSSILSST
jgi:hypothetical protein